jgi:hypothetical protein
MVTVPYDFDQNGEEMTYTISVKYIRDVLKKSIDDTMIKKNVVSHLKKRFNSKVIFGAFDIETVRRKTVEPGVTTTVEQDEFIPVTVSYVDEEIKTPVTFFGENCITQFVD